MATDVIMPVLGMAQDSGKIVQWLKSEGEAVRAGEIIIEVETDKAVMEIEATASGVLTQISAREGDEVPVAQVIAVILAPGETVAKSVEKSPTRPLSVNVSEPQKNEPAPQDTAVQISPVAKRIADEHQLDIRQIKPDGARVVKADVLAFVQMEQANETGNTFHAIPASPKARRMMAERGISPASVPGTGPDGAVIERDVLAFKPEPEIASSESAVDVSQPPSDRNVRPMSTTWQIMAERTTQSWVSAPHFYLTRELDVSNFISWRENVLKRSDNKVRITYTDLLVKVVAESLRRHPKINSAWRDDKIIQLNTVNIGLAMAVDDGLVVPVIHQADQIGLNDIATARSELADRAQNRKLRLQDVEAGSMTISNLGMYGVDAFNAILNAPQSAILAVGRIAERVVPVDGQVQIQPRMIVTLTCDHRVIDGALGALFLKTLAEIIEDPLRMID